MAKWVFKLASQQAYLDEFGRTYEFNNLHSVRVQPGDEFIYLEKSGHGRLAFIGCGRIDAVRKRAASSAESAGNALITTMYRTELTEFIRFQQPIDISRTKVGRRNRRSIGFSDNLNNEGLSRSVLKFTREELYDGILRLAGVRGGSRNASIELSSSRFTDTPTLATIRDGRELVDARFSVAREGDLFAITMESRSGAKNSLAARNVQYERGLEILLDRLMEVGATITGAALTPRVTTPDRPAVARLHIPEYTFPWVLRSSADSQELRRLLCAAQAATSRRPGAKGLGNHTKRFKMLCRINGFVGTASDLQTHLSEGVKLLRPHESPENTVVIVNDRSAEREKVSERRGASLSFGRPVPSDEATEQLSLVESVGELAHAVHRFAYAGIVHAATVTSLARSTRYWVYDRPTGDFGPAKFVGFAELGLRGYESARGGELSGARFDGHVTRTAIERVLERDFGENDELRTRLSYWLLPRIGEEALRGIDASKWRFAVIEDTQHLPSELEELMALVQPPPSSVGSRAAQQRVREARRVDWEAREAHNRSVGEDGERFVAGFERQLLTLHGRPDLAQRVEIKSKTEGDGLGYDVLSFTLEGEEKFIEVKTTGGGASDEFYISPREIDFSEEQEHRYWLYRVYRVGAERHFYQLRGGLRGQLRLDPTEFRARVKKVVAAASA